MLGLPGRDNRGGSAFFEAQLQRHAISSAVAMTDAYLRMDNLSGAEEAFIGVLFGVVERWTECQSLRTIVDGAKRT